MRRLAREEGIFAGFPLGVPSPHRCESSEVENATIVAIICDRGDRYLSTGVFDHATGLSFAIDASAWLSRGGDPAPRLDGAREDG